MCLIFYVEYSILYSFIFSDAHPITREVQDWEQEILHSGILNV